jgi:hypothetical protein
MPAGLVLGAGPDAEGDPFSTNEKPAFAGFSFI